MEELGTVLIVASNQKSNAERPTHDALLSISTFAEAQSEIADRLGAALNAEGLVVVEGVRLALNTSVLNHRACIGLETAHGAADVAVDLDNLLDGGGLEKGGSDALLNTQDDAL